MKIALNGYGRMGKAVERIATERGHEVVATFDEFGLPEASKLAGAEVIIDFSQAGAIDRVVETACEARVNLVVGTTGWNKKLEQVRERCTAAGIGVVHAANFSPGANIMFALARRAGALVSSFTGYEAGIEERHHSQKKDAPSGTAIRIAKEVESGSGGKLVPPVASSRVGAEFGLHTLFFDSPDDLIEISHRARGRDGFARGAVVAAELLDGRRGFFRLEELIGLD
jgi:4-hydroxy-tetrahydrodipicolinate reductase